jgi:hypothetical protein
MEVLDQNLFLCTTAPKPVTLPRAGTRSADFSIIAPPFFRLTEFGDVFGDVLVITRDQNIDLQGFLHGSEIRKTGT